ncbi:MAG: GGDEF domain-containing protein [Leptospiraceae bacterium]|nr:GGDEF domain-containing protein [Leptospiraceae bacterium]
MNQNQFINRLNTFVFQGGKRNRDFPLEKRIFNLTTLYGGFVLVFLIGPSNYFLKFSWIVQAINIATGIFLFVLAYISFSKGKQFIFLFLIVLLFFGDLLWFTNGGSQGSITTYLIIHLICIIILSRGKTRFYISVLSLVNLLAILIIEYNQPDLVIPYNNSKERFFDLLTGQGVSGIAIFLIISLVMKNYEKERKELKEQNLVLQELSLKDHLTGLYNRRYQMARLKEEIQNFNRYKHSFSILLIDIDFFKKINDSWGHAEGDRILVEFSEILIQFLRINDVSSRFGGEEFLVILPMIKLNEALLVSEKLRANVQKKLLLPDGSPTTLSIGVQQYHNESVADLLSKVDQKLYRAKKLGRNRVVYY